MTCKECLAFARLNWPPNTPIGECRRYPPKLIPIGDICKGVWPEVDPNDWCREFECNPNYKPTIIDSLGRERDWKT